MIGALKRAMEEEEACPLDSERQVNSTGERATRLLPTFQSINLIVNGLANYISISLARCLH